MSGFIQSGRFAAAAGYTPPLAGVARWWDPSVAATVTLNGSNVSQINDISGNGFHLAQATAGSQPSYGAASGWGNSLNVMSFDGVGDYLSNATNLDVPLTWFVVTKKPGDQATDVLINADGHATYISDHRLVTWTGSTGAQWTATSTQWTDAHVHCLKMTTTQGSYYIDGSQQSTTQTFSNLSGTGIFVGADEGGTAPGDWIVGEILVYPSALSDADRNTVEAALKTKWATP